jgi:SOS-response transcriptional repressor LexA
MKSVGKWVESLRKAKKMSRADVMRATGLSAATIVRLEGGEGGRSRSSVLAIGKSLGLSDADAESLALWAAGSLTEEEFSRRTNGLRPDGMRSAEVFLESRGLKASGATTRGLPPVEWITTDHGEGTPVLGEVTAGGLVESIVFDNGDEPDRVPIVYPDRTRTYALRIRGDSMSPEYRPGEILIVQDATRDELEDGEDAVIQCDGSADGCSTFKRCVFVGNGMVRLMPLNDAYKPAECRLDSIVRIGKVLGVYRPRKRAVGGHR